MSKKHSPSKHALDNRANQLNPNNDAYWKSRSFPNRQEDSLSQEDEDDGFYQDDDYYHLVDDHGIIPCCDWED